MPFVTSQKIQVVVSQWQAEFKITCIASESPITQNAQTSGLKKELGVTTMALLNGIISADDANLLKIDWNSMGLSRYQVEADILIRNIGTLSNYYLYKDKKCT